MQCLNVNFVKVDAAVTTVLKFMISLLSNVTWIIFNKQHNDVAMTTIGSEGGGGLADYYCYCLVDSPVFAGTSDLVRVTLTSSLDDRQLST